jgi:cell division septum initiation protein DivIVA
MAGLQEQIDSLAHQLEELQRRADAADLRAAALEAQAEIDRDMIAELQRDGLLSKEHAEQMEDALKSSRTVGAAIGLIMGSRRISHTEAFEILKAASQNSNRKLRDLAADLVASVGVAS